MRNGDGRVFHACHEKASEGIRLYFECEITNDSTYDALHVVRSILILAYVGMPMSPGTDSESMKACNGTDADFRWKLELVSRQEHIEYLGRLTI